MIALKKITWDNYEDVIALKINDEQKKFICSNEFTLAQCYVGKINSENEQTGPEGTFAIYNDDSLVGFSFSLYETDDEDEEDEDDLFTDKAWYNIIRFMIDEKNQNKGYGKKALAKLIEYFKTFPNGEATAVISSYKPGNDVMQKTFASLGFEEVGFDNEDGENIVRLAI